MQVCSSISEQQVVVCVDEEPPSGSKSYTITASPRANDIANPNKSMDIIVEAAFDDARLAFRPVARLSAPWVGGAGAIAPTLTWPFNTTQPTAVRGVIINGAKGAGSEMQLGPTTSQFA